MATRTLTERSLSVCLAEGVGFEPTVSCPTVVFKTTPFGRSGIPPVTRIRRR